MTVDIASALLDRFENSNPYYAEAWIKAGKIGYKPVREPLTKELLQQHLDGKISLGAYQLNHDNTINWLGWDIDSDNSATAKECVQKITARLGNIPYVVEDSAGKGYHVLIFLSKPMQAEKAKQIVEFVRDSQGLPKTGNTHVECFPKQAKLTKTSPLGNLLKIPLCIHPKSKRRSMFVNSKNEWKKVEPLSALTSLVEPKSLDILLEGHKPKPKREPKPNTLKESPDTLEMAILITQAISCLAALKPDRCSDYEMWRNVGFSLQELGKDGLVLWDDWSKKCTEKYEAGACAKVWTTFKEKEDAITFASLLHWAAEDHCAPFIHKSKKGITTLDYARILGAFGYEFSLNEMNDMIYVNGGMTSDLLRGRIEFDMRVYGYKSTRDTEVSILRLASDHPFHPIKDYLNGLVWDKQDNISKLSNFFSDKDDVFSLLLRKWLIGAVGRILGRAGQQHTMLVLDGTQGVGKSFFVRWLGSPLPEFYIESPIYSQDKDFRIRACSKFVWEVQELDTTVRRQDLGSLKAFLSDETVTVRKPYARYDINKPYTVSFIGTVNNTGGFLNDPTGNRRYRICTIQSIDQQYDEQIDVNQIWAQAVSLFKSGESWELAEEQEQKVQNVNARYEIDDPLAYHIGNLFNIVPEDRTHFLATAEIIEQLRMQGKIRDGESDRQISMRISNILTKIGCERDEIRTTKVRAKGWLGIWQKEEQFVETISEEEENANDW